MMLILNTIENSEVWLQNNFNTTNPLKMLIQHSPDGVDVPIIFGSMDFSPYLVMIYRIRSKKYFEFVATDEVKNLVDLLNDLHQAYTIPDYDYALEQLYRVVKNSNEKKPSDNKYGALSLILSRKVVSLN